MNEIKVESNVPIPKRNFRSNSVIGALALGKVGDSILMPASFSYGAIYLSAKKAGIKVLMRKQPDGQRRIWRTA